MFYAGSSCCNYFMWETRGLVV
uniref:Uncharacterized protein n=1 Tax=Rhizophora mucronata TaxID=61149 RepID=A0A2P2QC83_RHIMU